MSARCFFQFKGKDCSDSSLRDRAKASLAEHQVEYFDLEKCQMRAWDKELDTLIKIGSAYPDCTIAMEYMIPRMGKRADVVLLIDNYIFVIEFKVGEKTYPAAATDQVLDYSYDLKNFHSVSENRTIIPIVVCTEAQNGKAELSIGKQGICTVQHSNASQLPHIIMQTMEAIHLPDKALNHDEWLNAKYRPTPTIIEAAQALYRHNTVEDISRNEAGLTNIAATTECINAIVSRSKQKGRKSICFVTGVPGAGKTLVGLNLAATRRSEAASSSDEAAVFLSGNGPLIEVLQASLTEDQVRHQKQILSGNTVSKPSAKNKTADYSDHPRKKTKKQIESEVKSFIQGVHLFREELFLSDEPPHEHIAIFDESQRAWTEEELSRSMKTRHQNKREINKSEPRCLIEYMDRHDDWACMICLVGGGQEINRGEAGIIEWLKALRDHFPNWDVYASSAIQSEHYLNDTALKVISPKAIIVNELHLAVDMRSFRNKTVAAFVEAIISNKAEDARRLYEQASVDYPIYVTRDLASAKKWVRQATTRPSDRYGIVANSYGQRIRADGVILPKDLDAAKWFLGSKQEVDSSYYMEIAASEFKIQGLEIDFAIVAWEADYRYKNGEFQYHKFRGGSWKKVRADMQRRYLKNGYRVLLTRARQGFVIYVPRGSEYDLTRKPEFYDETYEYLLNAGIKELP